MNIGVIGLCVGAYVTGSLNAAVIVARSRGVDIRAVGSGNPGASNVYRSVGKGAAALVYVSDMLKGLVPTLVALLIWDSSVAAAVGLCAVAGHCFPIFHRFRGGKGVATAAGVLLVVAPLASIGLVLIYAVLVKLTGTSSVGSLTALAAALPLAALAGVGGWALVWLAMMILLIVSRHRSNISRLIGGSEHKVAS